MVDKEIDPAVDRTEDLTEMTAEQAVKMIRELCAQLQEGGVFHGNIWPGSVTVSEDGQAVLGEGSDAPVSGRSASQVEYLSPEYFWDSEGTPASDVYSLGLLLYAGCNGGYLPFQPKGGALTDKDRSGALRKRMKGEPLELPAGVNGVLGAVLKKALAYEPEDRYADPAALLEALNETYEALPSVDEADAVVWSEAPVSEEPAGDAAAEEPAAAETAAPAEPEKKYTVQKDIRKASHPMSEAPTSVRKKKASPVIPVLCIAAAAVILGGVWYALNHRAPVTSPTVEVVEVTPEPTEPVVVLEAEEPEATEAPAPQEEIHVVTQEELEGAQEAENGEKDGDEAEEPKADADAENAEPVTGSTSIGGQDVTAVSDTVYVTGSGVNLRAGPGTAYDVQTTLPRGTELKRTGTVSGWSQVQYEGKEYYVSSSLVSTDAPEGTDKAESVSGGTSSSSSSTSKGTLTVTSDVNVRAGAGTGYSILGVARTGTTLTYTDFDGKWYKVTYNGQTGYVNRNMVSESGSSSSSSNSSTPGKVEVVSKANVRTGPGTGYSILGVADVGTILTVTDHTSNNWYEVNYNGKTGYIAGNMVKSAS